MIAVLHGTGIAYLCAPAEIGMSRLHMPTFEHADDYPLAIRPTGRNHTDVCTDEAAGSVALFPAWRDGRFNEAHGIYPGEVNQCWPPAP